MISRERLCYCARKRAYSVEEWATAEGGVYNRDRESGYNRPCDCASWVYYISTTGTILNTRTGTTIIGTYYNNI